MSADARARFDRLILPHLDDGFRLARWLMGSPTDAEDVVQEACLRAFLAMDRLVEHDGKIEETGPGRDVGDVRHPKMIRPLRVEMAINQIQGRANSFVADRRTGRASAADADKAASLHQPPAFIGDASRALISKNAEEDCECRHKSGVAARERLVAVEGVVTAADVHVRRYASRR